jgi:hypothetical protein
MASRVVDPNLDTFQIRRYGPTKLYRFELSSLPWWWPILQHDKATSSSHIRREYSGD